MTRSNRHHGRGRDRSEGEYRRHDEADFIVGVTEATCRTIADSLHFLHRFEQETARKGGGRAGGPERDGPSTGDILFDMARLGLEMHERLLDMNFQFYERLFDRLRTARPGWEPPPGSLGVPLEIQHEKLCLSGSQGDDLTGTFYVLNPTRRRLQLRIYAGDFRMIDAQGKAHPQENSRAWCSPSPDTVELLPGSGHEITVTVKSKDISPGRYRGAVFVEATCSDYDASEIQLELQIRPARAVADPSKEGVERRDER